MIELLPFLYGKSFWVKAGFLLLIIASSTVLMMVAGIVIAIPFFGLGVLDKINVINDFGDSSSIIVLKYFQVINQVGVFILPAIIFAWLENRNAVQYLRIDRMPRTTALFFSILMIISIIPAINWMVEINEQMKFPEFLKNIEEWMQESEDKTKLLTEAFLNVDTIGGLVINLFIIGFLAAVGEELLFRGVILRVLFDGLKNIHLAVFLSSLLFSALHFQFYGFLPRTALGLIFGYTYIWSGSLFIPIILHFLFNSTSVVVAYLYGQGLISTDFDNFGVSGNNLIIAGSFFFAIMFLWLLYKNRQNSLTGFPDY